MPERSSRRISQDVPLASSRGAMLVTTNRPGEGQPLLRRARAVPASPRPPRKWGAEAELDRFRQIELVLLVCEPGADPRGQQRLATIAAGLPCVHAGRLPR